MTLLTTALTLTAITALLFYLSAKAKSWNGMGYFFLAIVFFMMAGFFWIGYFWRLG